MEPSIDFDDDIPF